MVVTQEPAMMHSNKNTLP